MKHKGSIIFLLPLPTIFILLPQEFPWKIVATETYIQSKNRMTCFGISPNLKDAIISLLPIVPSSTMFSPLPIHFYMWLK